MGRYANDRAADEALDRWPAPVLAHAIDRGLIDGWPWEVTRNGRRLGWQRLWQAAEVRDSGGRL